MVLGNKIKGITHGVEIGSYGWGGSRNADLGTILMHQALTKMQDSPVVLLNIAKTVKLFFRETKTNTVDRIWEMVKNETITYILLTFISAPIIHILFSLFGWKNYMLFINFPSIFEIIN